MGSELGIMSSEWKEQSQSIRYFAIRYFAQPQLAMPPFGRFGSTLLGLRRHRRDRHKLQAAAFRGFRPFGDPLDRNRKRRSDRDAALTRSHFEPPERVIDFGRRRHRIEDQIQ